MTNPNNIKDVELPVDPASVTAVAFYPACSNVAAGSLWIGCRDGSIAVCEKARVERDPFILRCKIQGSRQNYPVENLLPVMEPQAMICHWIIDNLRPGPVEAIYPGGVRCTLCAEANIVSVSTKREAPLIGVVTYFREQEKSEIKLMKFVGTVVSSYFWHKVDGLVQAFAVTDEHFVYLSQDGYHMYKYGSNAETKIKEAPSGNSPFAFPLTENRSLIGVNDFALVVGNYVTAGKMNVRYDGEPCAMLPTENGVYIAYSDNMKFVKLTNEGSDPVEFEVANAKCMAVMEDQLIVVTPQGCKKIGSIPKPSEMVEAIREGEEGEAGVDEVINKLSREGASECMYSLFAALWNQDMRKEALMMAKKHLIIGYTAVIVGLIPIIQQTKPPANLDGMTPVAEDDKSLIPYLCEYLQFTRSQYLKESASSFINEMPVIDTALAQCLAALNKCRELADLLDEGNVNTLIVKTFCQTNARHMSVGPAYAVVLSYLGDVEEAMGIWMKLEDMVSKGGKPVNPMFVDEASYTVRKLKDSTQLGPYLKWLLAKDPTPPKRAINALLSVDHDPAIVNTWLKQNNLMDYRMRYYCFIVCQSSKARGASVAPETLNFLLDILSEIDDDSFDAKSLDFTNAAQIPDIDKIEMLIEAKKEITNTVLQILEMHGDMIDGQAALFHCGGNIDRKVILTIHRVKKQYSEGLQLLRKNDRFELDEVQSFCRAAPEPPLAFSSFLQLLEPDKVIKEYAPFIEENLPWMNLTELIRLIPSTSRIKTVTPIVKTAFNLLMQRKMSLDMQIAMTESMLVDSRYRKTVQQSNYCTIEKTAKCATCGRPITIDQQSFTPPGGADQEIYHQKCKPSLQ